MLSDSTGIRIVKYLLKTGKTTQSQIAQSINGSIGYVNEVISHLSKQSVVLVTPRGISVIDPARLVMLTANEEPLSNRLWKKYLVPGYRIEVEDLLAKELQPWRYAFTLFSALSKYPSLILPVTNKEVAMYVDEDHLEKVSKKLEELGAKISDTGNVVIYKGSPGIFWEQEIDDSHSPKKYVSREQLIIDLHSYPPLTYIGVELLESGYKELMKNTIIDFSREELFNFTSFFDKKVGHQPIIIGGWAVYQFNNYYGSKDIDVIFNDNYQQNLFQYYKAQGYKEYTKDSFSKTFRKEFNVAGSREFIDVDVISAKDENTFHQDRSKKLPFALAEKNKQRIDEVGRDGSLISFYIPIPELLLLLKAKAYLDRDYDAAHRVSISPYSKTYFESKRNKDGADIIALLDTPLDYQKIIEIADNNKILDELKSTLNSVSNNSVSINWYSSAKGKSVSLLRIKIEELIMEIVRYKWECPICKRKTKTSFNAEHAQCLECKNYFDLGMKKY